MSFKSGDYKLPVGIHICFSSINAARTDIGNNVRGGGKESRTENKRAHIVKCIA